MSVNWNYYDKFEDINNRYLPDYGEGDTMATQICTAVNKLVYKWYNDGDVFDNTYIMDGWFNDLSSYANWLATYCKDQTASILERITTVMNDDEYEDMLKDLTNAVFQPEFLAVMDSMPKTGSVYDCSGAYHFVEIDDDDDQEWEWDDDDEE